MNFKLILFSTENVSSNDHPTNLKTDDGNKASLKNTNQEPLRRDERKGKNQNGIPKFVSFPWD